MTNVISGAAAVGGTIALVVLLALLAPRAEHTDPGVERVVTARPLTRAAPETPAAAARTPTPAAQRTTAGPRAQGRALGGVGAAAGPVARRDERTGRAGTGAPVVRSAAPGVAVTWPEGARFGRETLGAFAWGSDRGDGTGRGTGPGNGAPASPRPGVTRGAVTEFAPRPAYPWSARSQDATGLVEVLIHIDATGAVTGVDVVQSSGAAFEDAVRAAVFRWRFRPALRDGEPRPSTVRRRFEFRMTDR